MSFSFEKKIPLSIIIDTGSGSIILRESVYEGVLCYAGQRSLGAGTLMLKSAVPR